MHIFTEYSLWLFPICLLIGVGCAFFLYHKDEKLKDAPLWVRRLLFAIRAFVVTFVLFLILGPFVEMRKKRIEKPTIVVLHDNSASLVCQKDSSFYRKEYVENYQKFIADLREQYAVDEYAFGGEVEQNQTIDFSEKETNISNALQDVATRYYNQNVGAVVLATDGIYNTGENPKYAVHGFPAQMPVYTVALGDTIQECDNVISNVLHNQIAFRNNPFVVKISVESHALKGKTSKLLIREGNKIVYETSFFISDEHLYKTLDCKLQSGEIGEKIYTVSVEYFDSEISGLNNTYSFAVDVLESRQKIAILYDAVHPDVAAIRRAIESNKNYECVVACINDANLPSIRDCNCLVLVGLPNLSGKGKTMLHEAVSAGVPALVVYNQSLSIENLNSVNAGIEIANFKQSYDEVKPQYETDFSLFSLDDQSKQLLENVPPLYAPYGSYSVGVQCRTLCSQLVGNIAVNRPLIVFSEIQNVKIGLLLGEGIWRWRLYDYKMNTSFDAFDSFVNKMIAYLALAEKREMFTVNTESITSENTNVTFTAELYDKSFEPMPNREISLVVTNEQGTDYSFAFTSTENFYTLNAGKFPQGNYSYTAKTVVDGVELKKSGGFFVQPMQAEYMQTRANHSLLADIATESGGSMVFPNEYDKLTQIIRENQNIVSVSHTTNARSLLFDLPLILLLVIVSASAEWFLRKFYATY